MNLQLVVFEAVSPFKSRRILIETELIISDETVSLHSV